MIELITALKIGGLGGGNYGDSPSRDSGLGGDSAGIDNLSNGLNSMGLGGRGAFPFYGNQGDFIS